MIIASRQKMLRPENCIGWQKLATCFVQTRIGDTRAKKQLLKFLWDHGSADYHTHIFIFLLTNTQNT